MDFTDEQQRTLRAALGLADDVDLTAAAIAGLANRPTAAPAGMRLVADEVFEQMQGTITHLQTRVDNGQTDERHQVIAKALKEGKFTPAQRKHYERAWDADPVGARDLIAGLPKNVLPVAELGYAGGDGDDAAEVNELAEFDNLLPPHMRSSAKAGR